LKIKFVRRIETVYTFEDVTPEQIKKDTGCSVGDSDECDFATIADFHKCTVNELNSGGGWCGDMLYIKGDPQEVEDIYETEVIE
jgi:hypothetical protein